MNPTDSAVTGE